MGEKVELVAGMGVTKGQHDYFFYSQVSHWTTRDEDEQDVG